MCQRHHGGSDGTMAPESVSCESLPIPPPTLQLARHHGFVIQMVAAVYQRVQVMRAPPPSARDQGITILWFGWYHGT